MKNEGGRKRNIRVQRRESERPRELTLFVWRDRDRFARLFGVIYC